MTNKEFISNVVRILDGWFGESLEDAEDEFNRRKYLYEPLYKLFTYKQKEDSIKDLREQVEILEARIKELKAYDAYLDAYLEKFSS